ncbi:MAG: S8 family peptidase [Bacteroidia bacterium]|nr:S8 family peptidase [Bacteroidia bacterium]
MKSITFQFILFLYITVTPVQAQTGNARFSTNLLHWMHSNANAGHVVKFKIANTTYMSALMKVNAAIDENQLQQMGVIVGTKAGDIWTVRVPETQMMAFTKMTGIDFIELDRKARPLMDSVRYFTGIDSVHQGIDVPLLSGKGTIVGVLDHGFDYTHPAFYDTSYSKLRIQRVWDQRISGTPPAGFSYGTEFKDTVSMLQKKFSVTTFDHGMSTSSIAVGSGYGSANNTQFRGVAYDCDIALVESNADTTEFGVFTYATIIDGFKYIFNYADSVGKPAVINVSLGGQDGPHDGTSLFGRACDNITGPGKIIVFAAGNDGITTSHLQKTFTPADTSISTIVNLSANWDDLELWGDTGKSYCLEIGLFSNGVKGAKTQTICLDNIYRNLVLIGTDNDTSFISIGSEINVLNNKPHFAIRIDHRTKDSIYLTAKGTDGTAHLWISGEFKGNGTWATEGDSRHSVCEYASSKSCITVGAYSTRTSWKNIQNQVVPVPTNIVKTRGDIALFSSHGPTMDGRMKPEITAPGSMIGSATNSFSPAFRPGGGFYFCTVTKYLSPRNNRNYYYSMTQGTSVAAPVVTGAIALLLQVNPNLTVDHIRKILTATAIRDSFTTQNPDPAKWGAGKINAYAAIKETIWWVGTVPVPKNEIEIKVYPNPNNGPFTITYNTENSGYFLVEISTLTGQTVHQQSWELKKGENALPVDLTALGKGIYFLTITGQGGQVVKRIAIN